MKLKNYKMRGVLCSSGLIATLAVASYFLNIWFSRKEARSIQQLEDSSEPLVILTGKLRLQLFPGPPEYSSIENGDRADYCWVLELDRPSFLQALNVPVNELTLDLSDILKRSEANVVMLGSDKEMGSICEQYEHEQVAVKGHLFHAHTVHHYTPMLMDVKEVVKF